MDEHVIDGPFQVVPLQMGEGKNLLMLGGNGTVTYRYRMESEDVDRLRHELGLSPEELVREHERRALASQIVVPGRDAGPPQT